MMAAAFLTLVPAGLRAQAPPLVPAFTPLRAELYHDGWIDLNKNDRCDVYEDSTQPVDQRVVRARPAQRSAAYPRLETRDLEGWHRQPRRDAQRCPV